MRREVRILVLGDGKSTLIMTLVKEAFVAQVEPVLPVVTVPPEATPDHVFTQIVDTSSKCDGLIVFLARPEDREDIENEIKKCHVICIVYAVDDDETKKRVSTYWLPRIRSLGVNVPIVLIGNKIDIRGEDVTNEMLEEEMIPIMSDYKEVETCVECSAKTLLNVSEAFYFAQKAVLHPTAPLYDSREHVLKAACEDALKRIFQICDLDKDGLLNDEELNLFQRKCFLAPLQQQELEGIKEVVRSSGNEGVLNDSLTLDGFLYLHRLFIQRGRLETTWTVLRKFGYGDDLILRHDFLHPPLDVDDECCVELSPKGYQFFTELFYVFDKDKDGALNNEELNKMFSICPTLPWDEQGQGSTVTNDQGFLTLQGFLAQWSMTTLLDYRLTLKYLAYLGYEGDTTQAVKVKRSRQIDKKKGRVTRNTLHCYVFGATGSGKTSLLRRFIGKAMEDNYTPSTQSYSVVNTAEFKGKFLISRTSLLRRFIGKAMEDNYTPSTQSYSVVNTAEFKGSEKYLIMTEIPPCCDHEYLSNPSKMNACDLICLLYDSADVNSFSYIAQITEQFNLINYPLVVVATKSECDLVHQRFPVQPDDFCRKYSLPFPLSVSVKDNFMNDLYNLLAANAMEP
ncbi:EF hand associated, type-2 domain-containing protein [Rozella allomycis CSF55]|uniref:Mitochondrial Rho GTPase n=1 Tax=Rozella allomycis (strain CSF55) TaxID=988480 RepID=A0A075AR78_ROZAC|nr:EF hand associated, type-2 domain-containing protein [Rozella allomycis CSF55]|eukprot:EPZ31047.1 EF hand associated, type-2 domain-containing protein [Rozella allomycis CSF55]